MELTVSEECGASEWIVDRILAVAQDAEHEIENTTGLRLPPRVKVRLVDPRTFRRTSAQHFHRMFDAVRDLVPEAPAPLVGYMRFMVSMSGRASVRVYWRALGGQFFAPLGGDDPFITIMPRTLHLSQANENELRVTVIHELVHSAQENARPGLTLDGLARVVRMVAADNVTRKSLRADLPDISAVMEGHAQWAHLRVTRRVYGTDLRARETRFNGRGALSYRMAKKIGGLHPVVARKSGDYDRGEVFIDAVHNLGGLDLVNRVWTSMPTKAELESPASWALRVG